MIKLKNLILEKKGDSYEYGAVMLNIAFPKQSIHSKISESDLYEEEGDRTYGIEDEPHITLLFGLHSDQIKDNNIKECISKFTFPELALHNASLFENEKYDVLKFDVIDKTKTLNKCNKALKLFPYTNDFPEYHPHCTIAYIKKGLGSKYVKIFKKLKFIIEPEICVYLKPDGTKLKFEISKVRF